MSETKAENIIYTTASDYFPEIKVSRLRVDFVKGKDYYMAVAILFLYHLKIDKLSLKLSKSAFRGCVGHELAHIVLHQKTNIFKRIFTGNETREERETDLLVIEKGLGPDLLQFHIEHNKKFKSYKADEGLTKKEIKKILKL